MSLKIYLKIYKKFLKTIKFGILKKTFFLSSLFYFFFYFFENFSKISFEINFENNSFYLLISFLFCILSIYLNAFAFKNIVIWFGKSEAKDNIVSFYVLTNILKYVPGGIWHFFERFNFIKDSSNSQLAFYSVIIEPYFMLSASFLLSSIGIIFSPVYIFLVIPLIFLNRKLIYFVLQRLESLKGKAFDVLKLKLSKNKIEKEINLISFFPTKAFLFEIGFVLSKFLGFYICFNTLNSFENFNIFYLFVIFCLCWSIGLIIPTAPGGVGVFEACFLFFIGRSIPQNIILVGLIYFRVISTFAELVLSFPFLLRKLLKSN